MLLRISPEKRCSPISFYRAASLRVESCHREGALSHSPKFHRTVAPSLAEESSLSILRPSAPVPVPAKVSPLSGPVLRFPSLAGTCRISCRISSGPLRLRSSSGLRAACQASSSRRTWSDSSHGSSPEAGRTSREWHGSGTRGRRQCARPGRARPALFVSKFADSTGRRQPTNLPFFSAVTPVR